MSNEQGEATTLLSSPLSPHTPLPRHSSFCTPPPLPSSLLPSLPSSLLFLLLFPFYFFSSPSHSPSALLPRYLTTPPPSPSPTLHFSSFLPLLLLPSSPSFLPTSPSSLLPSLLCSLLSSSSSAPLNHALPPSQPSVLPPSPLPCSLPPTLNPPLRFLCPLLSLLLPHLSIATPLLLPSFLFFLRLFLSSSPLLLSFFLLLSSLPPPLSRHTHKYINYFSRCHLVISRFRGAATKYSSRKDPALMAA